MTIEELAIRISADTSQAMSNVESFGKKVQSTGQSISKASTPFLVAGTAITGALGLCVKAAAESEKSYTRLNSALKATGQYSAEQEADLRKLAGQMQDLTGVSDEAYAESEAFALQLGLTSDQTIKLIPHIADLSASTGVDMETAMRAAAMAVNGNVGMLQRYGIQIKKNEDGTVAFNSVLDGFAGYAGAAEAKGQTLQGQLSWVKETFGDLAEKVGNVLIPILKDFIEKYIKPLIEKLQKLSPQVVENAVKFVAVAGAILLVIGVVGKLIGLISGLGSLFTPTGVILVGIGAFIFLIVQVVKHWNAIKTAMKGFYEKYVKPWLDPLIDGLKKVMHLFEKMGNWFKKGINKITTNTIDTTGIGQNALGIGSLQAGGIVSKPGVYSLAEHGAEAVLPLNRMGDDESKRLLKDVLKELRKLNEFTAPQLGRQISLSVSGLGGKV